MKTKLVWRMGKLPTVDELRGLVQDKMITQEEAKDILFSSETEQDRDKKSLESEIKFLRELVEKLSSSQSKVVEIIKTIERPYYHQIWYQPYNVWCTNATTSFTTGSAGSIGLMTANNSATIANSLQNSSVGGSGEDSIKFSEIKTF